MTDEDLDLLGEASELLLVNAAALTRISESRPAIATPLLDIVRQTVALTTRLIERRERELDTRKEAQPEARSIKH